MCELGKFINLFVPQLPYLQSKTIQAHIVFSLL